MDFPDRTSQRRKSYLKTEEYEYQWGADALSLTSDATKYNGDDYPASTGPF